MYLFGLALDALGDFDGDGTEDLAVTGWEWLFEGEIGHVFVVLLRPDGTVRSVADIDATQLGIWPVDACPVWYGDNGFGWSVAALGDVDRDGTVDLGVGAPTPGMGGCCDDEGGAWVLNLLGDGSVRRAYEITGGTAPWNVPVGPLESFGHGLAALDLDHDGRIDLAVGAPDSRGTTDCGLGVVEGPRGSVQLLFGLP